jgi:hypothetical protein
MASARQTVVVVLGAIVVLGAGVAVGLAMRTPAATNPPRTAPASRTATESQAATREVEALRATASALRTSLSVSMSYSNAHELTIEPAGDISRAQLKRGVSFMAYVSAVSTNPLTVTFDVETQRVAPGSPSGSPSNINRHRHMQTLRVRNPYVPVSFMGGTDFSMPLGTELAEWGDQGFFPVMTFEEFVAQAAHDPELMKQTDADPEFAYLYAIYAAESGVYRLSREYRP